MGGLKNELASSKTTKDDKLKATMLLQEDAGGRNLGESSESQEEATLDASTEGMYDADVRATRAFTALDNEMDKLKTELSIKGSSKPLSASSNTDQSVTKSKDIGESEDQARDDDKDDDEDRDHDERDHDEDDDDRDEDRNRDEGQEAL